MKFYKVKKLLGGKHSTEEIKNIIKKIKPLDFKRFFTAKKNGDNLIIKIIKSKL